MNGAEVIIECLKENDVDTVFGYPGYSILSLYNALNLNKQHIRHILPSNEQHAMHAADGYARATGKTGVVIATSGPGVTNLMTGIATAFMDSSPIVVITGNVPLYMLGTDAFQEIDTAGITMPITKYNIIIKDPKDIRNSITRAFEIAQEGRKGPVLVDVPRDVLEAVITSENEYKRTKKAKKELNRLDITTAAALINEAKRPVILAGGGVCAASAENELHEFANRIGAPTFTTFMGKCAFSYKEKLFAGIMGGETEASLKKYITDADLLIAVGARFTERTTAVLKRFSKDTRVLHIDIDPAEIDKNVSADLYVVGDAKDILKELVLLTEKKAMPEILPDASFVPRKYLFEKRLFDILCKVFDDAIFTTDVGTHQVLAVKYLNTDKKRGFITSGGLGAMGFGLGAAVGAAVGTGGKAVNISGDGSFHMNMAELSTVQKYGLQVYDVVLNNSKLGLVNELQINEFNEEYQTSGDFRTDYKALAHAFGIGYLRVTNRNISEDLIRRFKENNKNGIIEYVL